MTGPRLRRARPEEAAAAAALLRALPAEAAAGVGPEVAADVSAEVAADVAAADPGALLSAQEIWLAEAGGAPAGIGAAGPGGRVTHLFVAPAHRRAGLGTALLRRLEAGLAAAGRHEARLDTTEAARPFYAARGWQPVGGTGMRKTLPAVRRLAPCEADLWRRIRRNALAAEPAAFAEGHDDWAGRPLSDFAERLAGSSVFLAEFGGAAVGCAELTPDADGAPGRGWVESVFVTRLARGRGVADALLAAVEGAARERGLTELCLDVGVANHAARAAYGRGGFEVLPERPDGADGACEITMRRRLD